MVISKSGIKKILAISVGLAILFFPTSAVALMETNAAEQSEEPPDIQLPHPDALVAKDVLATPVIGQARQTIPPKPRTLKPSSAQLSELQEEAKKIVAEVFGENQWDSFDILVRKESGWNPQALNRSSGACGIPQALPCSKLPQGIDTPPIDQVRWMVNYVKRRYGTPSQAVAWHLSHNWY